MLENTSALHTPSYLAQNWEQSNIQPDFRVREFAGIIEPLPSSLSTLDEQLHQCLFPVKLDTKQALVEHGVHHLSWESLQPHRHLFSIDSCPPPPKPRTADGMAEAQAWVERKLAEIKCSDQPSCIFFTDASVQTPVGTAAAATVMLPAVCVPLR